MPATFNDLVDLMDRLRSPGGCPWDHEQTYATLAPMLLEEAYEAFDALEEARQGRPDDLREELGDLLFQITFFARVAAERGEFTIDDVIEQVHAKMVRRHPHVFADTTAGDSAEVLRNWEAIKAEEKRAAGKLKGEAAGTSILDGVSTKAPELKPNSLERGHPCPPEREARKLLPKPELNLSVLRTLCGQGCPRSQLSASQTPSQILHALARPARPDHRGNRPVGLKRGSRK